MYGDLLGKLAGGAPPPGGAPAGPPLGAPPAMPQMPGLPPAPTGIGKMDTGITSGSPREVASDAVLKLRDLKGHFPALAPAVDGWIAQIVAAGKPGGAAAEKGANDGVDLAGGTPLPPPPAAPADESGGEA